MLLDVIGQADALEQLHDHVEQAALGLPIIIQRDRVRVAQLRDRERLDVEAPHDRLVLRELAQRCGQIIVQSLQRSGLFMSAALPQRVFPPMFNRYEGGEHFGNHVDNAIRGLPGGGQMRTDLSATLFLTEPEDYDGGELLVDDTFGAHKVKLKAGSMILYPATSLHRVTPVTRGARISAFFWVQSMVRDDAQRTLLFDLDMSIQRLRQQFGHHDALVSQTGVYHNLLRRWAQP